MKIYNSLKDFIKIPNAIVTSGTFDGVHVAHQKILQELKEKALAEKGEIVLLTFWPHPRLVLFPETPLQLINSFEEKAELLEKYGVDHLVKIPFTNEFSKISSQDFIQDILIDTIGAHKLIIGYNHRFGKNREGSFEYLKANQHLFPFEIEEISRQEIDNLSISSTQIRRALSIGEIEKANKLMGHPFSLSGDVIHGDKIGTDIGFPTANILVKSRCKLIPADGVYAVKVQVENGKYNGMLYIGSRPTLEGSRKTIEVNIFDFENKIYGKSISVKFIGEVRGDQKFSNLDALATQLHLDKISALEILKQE